MANMPRKITDIATGRAAHVGEEKARKALRNIANSADGEVLISYLVQQIMVVPEIGASDGACRDINAERRFARKLLSMMQAAQVYDDGKQRSGISK